jgi:ATP-binding cassette subfamily B protein
MEVISAPREIVGGTFHIGNAMKGRVTFEDVSFGYRAGQAALHNVSFDLEPGKTVAVVGATGAGKSTLVQLIPRFYDTSSGVVRIDGVDVREFDLGDLRQNIGVIFQETFLFTASVRENLAYGRPEATREQIEAAAAAAQAAEFIAQLERGYDTVVGERGVSLSGGQKQRLSIARALLLEPKILILDDATAAVDPKTERLIREAMRQVLKNRTAFIVAHRLSTVQHADEVLVLKEGRIVERGTPSFLLAQGVEFRRIFADQLPEGTEAA